MLTDQYNNLQGKIEKITELLCSGTEMILGRLDNRQFYSDALLYLNELISAAKGIEACCTGKADQELTMAVGELIKAYNLLSNQLQEDVLEEKIFDRDELCESVREQLKKVREAVENRKKSIMMLTGNIQKYALFDLMYVANTMHRLNVQNILDYGMTLQRQGILENQIEHGEVILSLEEFQIDGMMTENIQDDVAPAYRSNIYRDIYSEEQSFDRKYDMVWMLNRYDGDNTEQICREAEAAKKYARYILINILIPVQNDEKDTILFQRLSQTGHCITFKHTGVILYLLDCHPQKYQGKVGMYVVTHKAFLPPEDPMYIPIHAGRKGKDDLGYQGDDTGDNISDLNPYINEMTAAYWIWKHDQEHEYLGINHYRRYLNWKGLSDVQDLADEETILDIMKDYDVIVSEPLFFYPVSIGYQLREMFGHGKAIDAAFDVTRKAIRKYQPEYEKCFDEVMDGHNFICCNIFVTSREIYGAYCNWLFSFLPAALDDWMQKCSTEDREKWSRAMGFMTERLLSVWLMGQSLRVRVINGMATMKYCLPE